ncbi:hypothetical protein RFM98_14935 [Mesorhizobium sp. VK9D]|uniref:hypothetical protein n=1 Tax=Mesorhizobium australafricanum TaxID=3072311 RepID=UPI002A23DE32|nr:hypothetical protein [Mesorhizobium sp. VK9D]MDX8454055.1 hypothetical protein [Mesorhizobium sp. VK9D]
MQRFQIEAETGQRADAKRPCSRFVLEAWMILQPGFGADHRAVGVDLRLQRLGSIERLACCRQELDAGRIFNRILAIDRLPERHPVLAERPWWRSGQGRVVGN